MHAWLYLLIPPCVVGGLLYISWYLFGWWGILAVFVLAGGLLYMIKKYSDRYGGGI